MSSSGSSTKTEAIDVLHRGNNVFLTGAAGTGKTTLLKEFITQCTARGRKVFVTAMTGCAALLLGGRTLHAALAIGLADKPARELYTKACYYRKQRVEELRLLDCLIIDEISMCSSNLLDTVDEYLRYVRRSSRPFGGIQVIVVGDFCQLPPVAPSSASSVVPFAFTSTAWARASFTTVTLTTVHRQSDDPIFSALLLRARLGSITPEDALVLRATCAPKNFGEGIRPTRLFAVNRDVDRINTEEMLRLFSTIQPSRYTTVYGPLTNAKKRDAAKQWADSMNIAGAIDLCRGAQVMLTYNLDVEGGLVNGSRGIVEECTAESVRVRLVMHSRVVSISFITVQCPDDAEKTVRYLPLRVAYAISIHKSQGMTLDAVEMDLGSSIFEYGQAYTALSRARSLRSIRIISFREESFRTHPDVLRFLA